MNQLTKLFSYNGNEVTFRNADGIAYVNATEMAKPFGKHAWKWLELPSTIEFLKALSENRSLAKNQLVISVKGGNDPSKRGNWFHEDVALEYAQWLSLDFKLWCNDRIKELLQVGFTATPRTIEDMLSNPDMIIQMATQLKELRRANDEKDYHLQKANEVIGLALPKVEYYEEVLQSKSQITTNMIANEIGVSAIKLNQMLRERRVIYKQGNQWLLTAKYRNQGYTDTKTYTYTKSNGETGTDIQMRWTEKGREFIHNLFRN
ncbi:phage antirepressor protein [Sphingobacterium sp. SGG-5]|uniref:phage antirepressor KilAC domain-containing protein n=1 Tax=Sphingobacterium sp. SGG-5 TaxID=2710881 RepID=UPI0013EDE4A8|nr:phage antirepressor KilAC domain-containing protein [Sphingobacterium sp. SGG-5]NGM63552.1 phage antirepressor protein [Sphingobacterium sp. SGG-5]